jgi:hypothetical protein
LIAVLFFLAFIFALIAPLTITENIMTNIPTMLDTGTAEIWAEKARAAFGRYAESYLSTGAVLLGLKIVSSKDGEESVR